MDQIMMQSHVPLNLLQYISRCIGIWFPTQLPARVDCAVPTCSGQVSFVAEPISEIGGLRASNSQSCYVDYRGKLYEVFWSSDSMNYPDLTNFPEDTVAKQVNVSHDYAKTWFESTLIAFGSFACIRCLHSGPFPIVKIAFPTKKARANLQYEFDMLQKMSVHALPIVKYAPDALFDDAGMYGYRMESLHPLIRDYKERASCIRNAVQQMHDRGFSHGDLSPSNVMRDDAGRVVLIDYSYSGVIGSAVPSHISWHIYEDDVFNVRLDEERINMFFR